MNATSTEKKICSKEDDQYIVDKTAMSNIESTLMHDNGIGEDYPNSRTSTFSTDARNLYSADMRGTTTEEDELTSLYFPQAASLYDTAHDAGMHATDDAPIWGDSLDDLTSDMLSDNEEFLNLMSSQNNDDITIGGKSSDLNTTTNYDDFKDVREGGDQPVAVGDSFIDFYRDTDLPIYMDTLDDNMYIGVLPQVSEKSMDIYKDGNLFNDSYTMSNSSKEGSVETLETPESTTEEEEDHDDEEKTSQEPVIPASPARCILPLENLEKNHKKQVLDTPPSEPESLPVVTPQALKTSSSMLVPGPSLDELDIV